MTRTTITTAALLAAFVFSLAPSTRADSDAPAIKEWSKVEKDEQGKRVRKGYMTINGVLVHETDPAKQPQPKVITPGTCSAPDRPGSAPSDAVVLFDGKDLNNWTSTVKDRPTKWIVKDGAMMPTRGSGYIRSKQEFGSCQLHVEWATPAKVTGRDQGRGNSGVFLLGRYEVQILDSYNNTTYPDGQAGALYGRSVPLVNACRKPGEWQSFDIIFHRPVFDGDKVVKRATFTVLHNGVLIQDHVELTGGTDWRGPHAVSPYKPHGDKGPIKLQDHGNPVRFRNIWVRELKD